MLSERSSQASTPEPRASWVAEPPRREATRVASAARPMLRSGCESFQVMGGELAQRLMVVVLARLERWEEGVNLRLALRDGHVTGGGGPSASHDETHGP